MRHASHARELRFICIVTTHKRVIFVVHAHDEVLWGILVGMNAEGLGGLAKRHVMDSELV